MSICMTGYGYGQCEKQMLMLFSLRTNRVLTFAGPFFPFKNDHILPFKFLQEKVLLTRYQLFVPKRVTVAYEIVSF